MIDILPEDLPIWKAHNFKCVVHPERKAVCLHEEPPKSLNPNWKKEPEKRFPVCNECHEKVHTMNREDAASFLAHNREINFPDVLRLLGLL